MHLPRLGEALIAHVERVDEAYLLSVLLAQLIVMIRHVDILTLVLDDSRVHTSSSGRRDKLGCLSDRLS